MKEGDVIARSVVTPGLKKQILGRGTLIAGLGMLILLFAGGFLPLQELKLWGFPLFLLGGGLIVAGLLPYKRLSRLEMNPYELCVGTNNTIDLLIARKKLMTIPVSNIKDVVFIENEAVYGLGIRLNQTDGTKMRVHDPKYRPKSISGQSDLFLPYFSKRGVAEVQEFLTSES